MKVPLLNFVGGPGVPLLNFEEGPGVPFLNFRGVPGPTFNEGSPGSRVPESWSQFYTMPFKSAMVFIGIIFKTFIENILAIKKSNQNLL